MNHPISQRLARFEDALITAAATDVRRARRRRLVLLAVSAVVLLVSTGFGATSLWPSASPTVIAPLPDPVVAAKVAALAKAENDCLATHGVTVEKDSWGNLNPTSSEAVFRTALAWCRAEHDAGVAYEQTPAYRAANAAAAAQARLVWACIERKGYTQSMLAATNDPPPGFLEATARCKANPDS